MDLSELEFRCRLAFSHPLPMILIFVFVQAGLRHVFCPATALLDPSLVITASKRALLDPSLVIIVIIIITASKRTFRTRVEGW